MTAYFAWWLAGGIVGVLAGLLVLRHRGALSWRVAVIYLAATLGCLYGAKVQYRLRFFPPVDALVFSPAELLTAGFHIPLGLVGALVAAMLACRVLRAPALQIADALAITVAAMMPLGRMGCLVAGCCTGTVCPSWLSAVCVPHGSVVHTDVDWMAGRFVSNVGTSPLEVHLLPAYFAGLGLALVGIHLALLRRRMPPGTLVAVGLLLYPLGHLAIEQLRDDPSDAAGAGSLSRIHRREPPAIRLRRFPADADTPAVGAPPASVRPRDEPASADPRP